MNPHYDVVVIGSGPSGQKAAIQAAKGDRSVAICEQDREIGGSCVHHGTIPSKALRESALRWGEVHANDLTRPDVSIADLIGEVGHVVQGHDHYMTEQLIRNGVEIVRGRAAFIDPHRVCIQHPSGDEIEVSADNIVIATGSEPRHPPEVPIDHEFIFDSDSILSLAYLPRSLAVLGAGVIACEYASIFAVLGVEVTMIDRYPMPLGFLDGDLTARFVESFENCGGRFMGNANIAKIGFDGVSGVETTLDDGTVIASDKALCALGRVSRLSGLRIENSGVEVSERDLVVVNDFGQTCVPHIYAAGDVIGPPSLASASMEQGRRAARHILGLDMGRPSDWIPSGIYAVPELACVGLTEDQTREEYGHVLVGRSDFSEIARGHISRKQSGMLKLVASPDRIVRGVHIVGEQATDLVHIGQMGLLQGATLDTYVDNVFNFPTYAESYRVAALSATSQTANWHPGMVAGADQNVGDAARP